MRALEAFHEAEQIRLALRQTLRIRRDIESSDVAAAGQPSRTSTPGKVLGEEDDSITFRRSPGPSQIRQGGLSQGQALIFRLPDAVVLDDIIGSYLDFDTILLVLPQLSKDWHKAVWDKAGGGALWKRLCTRAWTPLNLPMKKLAAADNDWQSRFLQRPCIRLSGPYATYTVFIQYPGPRSMWTPRDAPSIKVVYHYRIWWFREDHKVLYIALSTRTPEKIIEMMRREIITPGEGSNSPEIEFWMGSYDLYREDSRLLCDVDIPHARHGVRFRFELGPGGNAIRVLTHRSYRFKTPMDFMSHPLPECEDDHYFKYRPGFL